MDTPGWFLATHVGVLIKSIANKHAEANKWLLFESHLFEPPNAPEPCKANAGADRTHVENQTVKAIQEP